MGRTMEGGTWKGFMGARIKRACENAVTKPAGGKRNMWNTSDETLTNASAQVQLNENVVDEKQQGWGVSSDAESCLGHERL